MLRTDSVGCGLRHINIRAVTAYAGATQTSVASIIFIGFAQIASEPTMEQRIALICFCIGKNWPSFRGLRSDSHAMERALGGEVWTVAVYFSR